MPKVINLKGRKPQDVPKGAVYIGRRMKPRGKSLWDLPKSKWANTYEIDKDGAREEVIAKYEAWLRSKPELIAALPELRGKDLACWCSPKACHGDVLLRLVELEAKGEL
jgi:hypothetical protein